jgi:hypothetical protein
MGYVAEIGWDDELGLGDHHSDVQLGHPLTPHDQKTCCVFLQKKSRVGKVGILNYIPGNNLNIAIASPTTTLP